MGPLIHHMKMSNTTANFEQLKRGKKCQQSLKLDLFAPFSIKVKISTVSAQIFLINANIAALIIHHPFFYIRFKYHSKKMQLIQKYCA